MPPNSPLTLYTIGHSTRTLDEFLAILHAHHVRAIADVRTVPRSRRVPHFNTESLPASLAPAAIEYFHLPALGGLRKTRPDSPNTAWRNASFRGYADYMQTPEFAAGLDQLIAIAADRPTAIMCAEAVPWRCHRSLIADAMLIRGWQVLDLMTPTSHKPHKLTDFAHVQDHHIIYNGASPPSS